MYNILILGSGGREHTLAWKIAKSPKSEQLYVAPGNAGTSEVAVNLNLDISDFESIKESVDRLLIDYLIVGPEAPLVDGIYDYFIDHNVKVIGPSKAASMLEGSKSFANAFMSEFNIPTAASHNYTSDNIEEAMKHIDNTEGMIVLKADGLAAGKGVLILEDKEEAKAEIQSMLSGKFGDASKTVVIEDFLDGIEFSVFIATDGSSYALLPVAKDYKRIGEGDTGLNTGGMGAVSPPPFVDADMMNKVKTRIIEPTLKGLQERNLDYKGFVFFGLISVKGEPYVIEYNCRLGDPETEVVIPRITSDFVNIIEGIHDGNLSESNVEISSKTAATIMLVSKGYPEKYEKGKEVIIDQSINDSIIFHAGTTNPEYDVVTNGGRVIAVTSFGDDHQQAVNQSLQSIEKIYFDGMTYRTDIGFDL
jgi:phosphoribosylamine--glycine ligase